MKKIIYILILALPAIISCEDIYIAELDTSGQLLVVEARLNAGQTYNTVSIYKTIGFYDEGDFPPVTEALVNLIDDENNTTQFTHNGSGSYSINSNFNPALSYKLQIIYNGETYESAYEKIPEEPCLDTVYGEHATKKIITTNYYGEKELETYEGIQLYADIKNDEQHYYLFDSRKIRLSTYTVNTEMLSIVYYVWKSFYPNGAYQVATSSDYSFDYSIYKTPLDFMNAKYCRLINSETGERERSWIYIIYQYAIPKSAYLFYKELNKQLEAEGQIFDPIYSQAYGNIKCVSNDKKTILGNFEIYNYKQHRYFLKIVNYDKEYKLEKINTFYNIPTQGEIANYPPDWWIH